MKFLFWNIQGRPLGHLVRALVDEHDVDVVVLAEVKNPRALLDTLNAGLGQRTFHTDPLPDTVSSRSASREATSMTTRNLWGTVPETKEKEDSPLAILREQGQLLADMTRDEVRGLVVVQPYDRGPAGVTRDRFGDVKEERDEGLMAELYFQVPKLDGYRYLFLEVTLPVTMGYPVVIRDVINDTPSKLCRSREEFEEGLQAAFQSNAVHEVIAGLRTASRSRNQEQQPDPLQ